MAATRFGDSGVAIERLDVSAYTVPTDSQPESDGTYTWDKTTIVIVEASAGGKRGLGYSYADVATATLVCTVLLLARRLISALWEWDQRAACWYNGSPVRDFALWGWMLVPSGIPNGIG
jgi:hypothetical protein